MSKPSAAAVKKSLVERIQQKIEVQGECWIFTGALDSNGYGRVGIGRREEGTTSDHIAMYEHHQGSVPEGLELDHLCRAPACCRPEHLEPVTHAENLRRAFENRPRVSHCPEGHAYDEENTYWYPDGRRMGCRTCRRRDAKAYYHRKKVA